MSKIPPVKVIPAVEKMPVALEVMENAILEISKLGKQIDASRLKRRAILLLIKDETNVGMGEIDAVLNCLPLLEKRFLK